MSYVFRIHNHGAVPAEKPMDANGVMDWTRTQYFEGQLNNAIDVGTIVGNIGTSIPSIFARAMLFDLAFKETGRHVHKISSINTKLISECLDMLELLYQHGSDTHLVVKKWVAANQIHALIHSGDEKLQKLGNVLNDNLGSIGNPNEIYLFYWKDIPTSEMTEREVLIGASSPLTLVFTSPNWIREMVEYGWSNKFKRTDNTPMFDVNHPEALEDRYVEFRKMLFDLRMAYNAELGSQAKGLYQYIIDSIANARAVVPPMTILDYGNTYKNIGHCAAGVIPICYKEIVPNGGYIMKLTKAFSAGFKVPMALTDEGVTGVPYIGASLWGHNKIDDAYVLSHEKEEDRELPGGMGVQYPFVCTHDFLEDKILRLEAPLKRDKFLTLTAYNNGTQLSQEFLLPLKQKFFKYFTLEDLKDITKITTLGNGSVQVTLNIPIVDPNHPTIIFKKVYDNEHIHNLSRSQIGFYPFYRTDTPALNRYEVVSTGSPKLSFYTLNQADEIKVTSIQRSNAIGLNIPTFYYSIEQAFDYVIVSDGNVRGMIIPKMTQIEMAKNTKTFKFAIDFGTSNTMIAYSEGTDHAREFVEDSSTYVVYLHEHNGTYIEPLGREFMPTSIKDNDKIEFPIKTAVCEVTDYQGSNNNEIFGKINVGFAFMREAILKMESSCYEYDTDLKWSLENNPGKQDCTARVRHFCLGLLWLIKNKAILGGGSDNFSVRLTFPKSMLNTDLFYDRGALATGTGTWQWAARSLGLNNITFDDSIGESEAPYYKTVRDMCDMLNVDIGGGTTDLFFVVRNPVPGCCKFQSVRFAANDLWGDGYGVGATIGGNGFVQYIQQCLHQDNRHDVDNIVNTAKSSSDVMAMLFNRDADLLTSQKIKGNDNLRSVLIIHFTALLYHIARVVKSQRIPIPKDITFSGMGSLYIKLISSQDSRLTTFVRDTLEYLTDMKAPVNFNLMFGSLADAKQNTALGALEHDCIAATYDLSNLPNNEVNEQGLDSNKILDYQSVLSDNDNVIYEQSKLVFDDFITFLSSDVFSQAINNNFGFGIPKAMIDSLKDLSSQSFINVKALLPTNAPGATVRDSLFLWHIKGALYQLAVQYH